MSLNLEQLWSYVLRNYVYVKAGLRLTSASFITGASVYEYGVFKGEGLSRSVTAIVGYRYRRMEVFVKHQCKLYEAEKLFSWRHKLVIIKCKGGYSGEKEIEIDVQLFYPDPFMEDLDDGWCKAIFQLMLEETPFFATPVEWGEPEFDVVRYVDVRADTLMVTTTGLMDVYVWKVDGELKKHYGYEFRVETTLYLPFGRLKKGVRRPMIFVRRVGGG